MTEKMFKNIEFGFKCYKKLTPFKIKFFCHCVLVACLAAASSLYGLLQYCPKCCVALGFVGVGATLFQELFAEKDKDDRPN